MRCSFVILFAALSLVRVRPAEHQLGTPVPHTHAHNDYEHTHPLWDALAQGFTSVEADIYLVNGQLLVAHDRKDLVRERTLEKLYLEPLRALVRENHGAVYPTGTKIVLLIDIKTEGEPTYGVLKPLLQEFAPMLTRFRNGKIETNAVTVILSGNRPRETLLAETDRLAAYDGRLSDLGQNLPISFMPLVSDNLIDRFPSAKQGKLSEADRHAFEQAIRQAHAEGRAIRFWATGDSPATWRFLRSAGVDWLNTDDLAGLAAFLKNQ